MFCAEIVLELKNLCSNIQLECVIPSAEQTKGWSQSDITRYNKIVTEADRVICLFERYNRYCNQVRNKYMVNNSELVLAVWNGEKKGGTYSTMQYATQKQTELKVIELG